MNNAEKGNRLEEAIKMIESVIIQSSPGYLEANFRIESKKIVTVQGVRHEIDLWVTAQFALGYEAIFIFECKNREEKVNKNDIIIFSEKVKVTNAAGGYFVAKSFTEDALAQIALDPRMKSVIVTELDSSSIPMLIPFRLNVEDEDNYVWARTRRGDGMAPIIPSYPFALDDDRTTIGKFISDWKRRSLDLFPARTMAAGEYPFTLEARMTFGNREAYLAGIELAELNLHIEGVAVLEHAVLFSAFDIGSRGRIIRSEFATPLSLPGGGAIQMGPIDLILTKVGS